MHMKQGVILLAAIMLIAGSYADPVQVSVTGTADTTKMGYTSGQSYTFTWVVNDGYSGSAYDFYSSSMNRWSVQETSDQMLWSSISGDGLSGVYSRPAGTSIAPYDILQATASALGLFAYNDDAPNSSQGLSVDGIAVTEIQAYDLDIPGLDYSDTAFVNPASWLAGYVGTHALSTGKIGVKDGSGNQIAFTSTSATIEAIPEPATLAFVGIFGGGLWFVRRYFPSV